MKRLSCLAVLVVLAVPGSAPAATKTYVGKTEQGYRTSAKLVDGELKWLKLDWRVNCKDPGYVFGPLGTIWIDREDGPIEQTGRKFTDGGTREQPLRDRHKAVIEEGLAGEILSGGIIKATHTVRARIYNSKGKQYDYCRGSIDLRLKRR